MRFSSSNGRGNSFSNRSRKGRGGKQARNTSKARRMELLEPRQMLTVTLNPINNVQLPGGQVTYVPLTGVDSNNQPITYTFKSTDPNVQLSLQSTTSKTLVLNVSGTDNTGTAFTGTLELHLFEDLAPITTARIESLVNSGFYNGQDFFRVIDGFVAQNSGSSGQSSIGPEPTAEIPFTSPGLLSLANTGQANGFLGDAQFFITAIDKAGSTASIPLAEMPQGLQNGSSQQFTVFGQLVSGFDTFEKIMSTTVQANPSFGGEVSSPTHPITITSASLITDTQNAVLKITAPASFDGNSAIITVTATGSGGQSTQQVFSAAAVINPPQIGPVTNQTTTATTPVTFTLQSGLNDQTSGAVYRIFDASTLVEPTNATISINQSTGQVTITPKPGFKGTLNLLAGVRSSTAPDAAVDYDTTDFTLTVTANPAIKPTLDSVINQTTAEGAADNFTLTSTDNGANGVVYKVADATTFGTPANATVSINQSTGVVTVTPNAGFVGTINLVAGVRSQTDPDTQASYATQTFTLTVLAPVLSPIGNQTIAEGAEDDFTLSATDPVGHGLVYKIVDATTHQPPANVTVSVDSQGNVTLTPDAGFTGSRNLLAEVRSNDTPDVQANYVTQAFTLNVVAPVLDAVSDQTIAMGVQDSFTLSATDPIGHGLVYQIVDPTKGPPANITATVDSSGHVTLTPAAGFSGTVSLLAEVRSSDSTDDQDNFVTQEFTLNVVAPTLDSVPGLLTPVGVGTSVDLSGHDSLGNGLVYKSFNTESNVDVTVDPGTGHVTLTPHAGASGVFTIQVGVRDTTSPDDPSNYVQQTITLTVGAPVFTIADQTTTEGVGVEFDFNASDPIGHGLVYKIVDATTGDAPTDATVVIDQTGHVTITPVAGFVGTVNLLAEVRDVDSPEDPTSYTVQPFALHVVALEAVADQATGMGAPITITLSSSSPGADVVFKIVDGTTFTDPQHVTIVSIDNSTGQVVLKPDAGFTGTISLRAAMRVASADDVEANYDVQTFTLDVLAPTIDDVADQTMAVGATDNFALNANDPTGQGLIYKIVDATTLQPVDHLNATVDANGNVTIAPDPGFTNGGAPLSLVAEVREAGSDDVQNNYVVTDPFSLTIADAPTLDSTVGDQTAAVNVPVTFMLTSTDSLGNGVVYKIFGAGSNATVDIDNSTGDVTITPIPGFSGTLPLQVGVRDATSADDPANYSMLQDFDFNVVAPTLDAVSPIITPIGVGTTADLSGHDTLGNSLVYKSFNTSSGVDVTVDPATGHVTMTPHAGASGSFSIQVGVRDSTSPDDPANYTLQTITLNVPAPSFNIADQTTVLGKADSFDFNATDPIGHGLTYKVFGVTAADAANVTVTVDPTGHVTVTPVAGFSGTVSLRAEVREADSPDVDANYVTQDFTLNVISLNAVSNQTTGTGSPISFNLTTTPSSTNVVYKIVDGSSFTAPQHVTATVDASGHVTLKPDAGFAGTITIRAGIRAAGSTDTEGNYDFQTFTLTVVAPVLGAVTNQTVAVGATNTFTLTGTDNSGQGLVYKIVDASTMQPAAHITATVDSTGHVTIVPDAGFSTPSGTPLSLIAEVREAGSDDVQSNYVTQPFTLTIVAPTLDAVANQTTTSNTAKTVQLTGHDTISGSTLFYKNFTTGVTNVTVTVNSSTGAVTLTPTAGTTGTFTIKVGVRDSTSPDVEANYAEQSFTLTVTAPPIPRRRPAWRSMRRAIPDLSRVTAM